MYPNPSSRFHALIALGRVMYVIFNDYERNFIYQNRHATVLTQRQWDFLCLLENRASNYKKAEEARLLVRDEGNEEPDERQCLLACDMHNACKQTHDNVLKQIKSIQEAVDFQEQRIKDGQDVPPLALQNLAIWKSQVYILRYVLTGKD